MFDLPGYLGTLANLIVVIIGFGLIVFVHELGHFVAAKWAGIRVLAFSMGFGPVVCSYRKGIGFRRGSSEPEYLKGVHARAASAAKVDEGTNTSQRISPTEYRFSALPLGGYVKMLGQEDLNPGAASSSPDSYQNCPIPKRLVVISAGVVVNVITAAMLFIVVFMIGLPGITSRVGTVIADSPASKAIAIGHDGLESGIQRGDLITRINKTTVHGFRDIETSIAMASKSSPSEVEIIRDGFEEPIVFQVMPEVNRAIGMLDLGVGYTHSTKVTDEASPNDWVAFVTDLGGLDIRQGDQLTLINGQAVDSPYAISDAASVSGGQPITMTLAGQDSTRQIPLETHAKIERTLVEIGEFSYPLDNILGLTGVLCVDPQSPQESVKQGLEPGDVFVRIGTVNHPSVTEGIRTIQSLAGQHDIEIEVLRDGVIKQLSVDVTKAGTIGFLPGSTIDTSNLLGSPASTGLHGLPAARVITRAGTKLLSIDGHPVGNLRDVQALIVDQTRDRFEAGDDSFDLLLELELPLPTQPDGSAPITTETWTLTRSEVEKLRDAGWELATSQGLISMFQPEMTLDRAAGPVAAIKRGIHESRRVMNMTYLTFVRLAQGTVKVKHLKGPVGIAHLGTQVADQGFMMMLFFLGLISINLAVINFLPLPVVDGGQFLILIYEWVRGKPPPIVFLNAVTSLGLLFIVVAFLYITFQDITNLFGG